MSNHSKSDVLKAKPKKRETQNNALTPSALMRISFPAAANRARKMLVAVPV